jgi:hypothetical protein
MGHKTSRLLEEEPLLALLWEEYLLCRAVQFVVITKAAKGGKGEVQVPIVYPTHIASWPLAGGVRDQPYLVTKLFAAFLQGDQQGTLRSIR